MNTAHGVLRVDEGSGGGEGCEGGYIGNFWRYTK